MSGEKYIAGYQKVEPWMMVPIPVITNEELVLGTIPIYTRKNPHPTRKRPADCAIEISCKQGWRMLMLRELEAGADRGAVIEKYKQKVAEL